MPSDLTEAPRLTSLAGGGWMAPAVGVSWRHGWGHHVAMIFWDILAIGSIWGYSIDIHGDILYSWEYETMGILFFEYHSIQYAVSLMTILISMGISFYKVKYELNMGVIFCWWDISNLGLIHELNIHSKCFFYVDISSHIADTISYSCLWMSITSKFKKWWWYVKGYIWWIVWQFVIVSWFVTMRLFIIYIYNSDELRDVSGWYIHSCW